MPAADFPDLLKHMTMAIYRGHYLQGSKERKLLAALEIAISRLIEWNHMESRSLYGPPFFLTSKGRQRESVHNTENKQKSVKFDRLYHRVESAFEGRIPDPKLLEALETRIALKRLAQERKSYAIASASKPNVNAKTKKRARVLRPRRATVKRAKRA